MTSSPDDPALYLYAQGHVALNLHATGNGDVAATSLSHRYLYAPSVDSLLAFETFGGRDNPGNSGTGSYALYWTALDHQNSVRDVLTSSGTVREHRDYDSFGQITAYDSAGDAKDLSVDALDTVFGFAGREWDNDAGLYYNRARWFSPALGRFLSEDPLGFNAGDSNLYRYAGGDPVNFRDPSGMYGTDGWLMSDSYWYSEPAYHDIDFAFFPFGDVSYADSGISFSVGHNTFGAASGYTPGLVAGSPSFGFSIGMLDALQVGLDQAWQTELNRDYTPTIVSHLMDAYNRPAIASQLIGAFHGSAQDSAPQVPLGFGLWGHQYDLNPLSGTAFWSMFWNVPDQVAGWVGGRALGVNAPIETASGFDLAVAAGGGTATGGKAVINAGAGTAVSTLTLGTVDYAGPLSVTDYDRSIGYNASYGFARVGTEIGAGLLTGAAGNAGRIGRAVAVWDTAGNAVGLGQGLSDAYLQGGLTWQNGVQIAGNAAGLAGNLTGATRAAVASTRGGVGETFGRIGAKGFMPPRIFTNRHGQLTNGVHVLDDAGMAAHTTGSLASGKSQFLFRVNEKQLVLDAAAYADNAGLWVGNKARIILDRPIGVHGSSGELTNVLNIYRNKNGFIHGAPGSPQ